MILIMNCPGCAKQYEIDGSLAGKKSRCKSCGEVFRIPVPTMMMRESPEPARRKPRGDASGPGRSERGKERRKPRASFPDDKLEASPWQAMLAEEVAFEKSPPAQKDPLNDQALDAQEYPAPRRAQATIKPRRKLERSEQGSDLGITIGLVYVAISVVLFFGLLGYGKMSGSEWQEFGRLIAFDIALSVIVGAMLALAGYVWNLTIAFGEQAKHGLLCIFCPFYQTYYTFTRWEYTRGAFILQICAGVPYAMIMGFVFLYAGSMKANSPSNSAAGYSTRPGAAVADAVGQPQADSSGTNGAQTPNMPQVPAGFAATARGGGGLAQGIPGGTPQIGNGNGPGIGQGRMGSSIRDQMQQQRDMMQQQRELMRQRFRGR